MTSRTPLAAGIDRIDDHLPLLRGRRIGVLATQASVDRDLRPTIGRLLALDGVKVDRLFAPEHGLDGTLTAGEKDHDGTDPATGLPVVALYGPRTRPEPQHLAGIDAVVCDLPDVGCRAFTYLATLLSICRAAAEAEVAAVILDRPNPIGGIVEGGGVVAGQENFVAPYDLPLRHGLTLGEVARLFCAEQGLAPPAVVPCDGWQRTPIALGSVYVSPSPNMPTPTAALAYPGAVLLEGTGLSEGRGTVRPFTLLGAPGIDGDALARHLAVAELPGLRVRAARFRPAASKHAGALCGGVELYVDDPRAWRALPVVLEILAFIRDRHGASLEPGAFLDRLSGGTTLREWCLTSGADPRELIDPWTAEHDAHRDRVAPHLLYRAEP